VIVLVMFTSGNSLGLPVAVRVRSPGADTAGSRLQAAPTTPADRGCKPFLPLISAVRLGALAWRPFALGHQGAIIGGPGALQGLGPSPGRQAGPTAYDGWLRYTDCPTWLGSLLERSEYGNASCIGGPPECPAFHRSTCFTGIDRPTHRAARLAPTARNVQPWEFVVVTEASKRRQLAALTDHGKFIAEAPVCVAVLSHETKYYIEDCSAATTSILLAAAALGLAPAG